MTVRCCCVLFVAAAGALCWPPALPPVGRREAIAVLETPCLLPASQPACPPLSASCRRGALGAGRTCAVGAPAAAGAGGAARVRHGAVPHDGERSQPGGRGGFLQGGRQPVRPCCQVGASGFYRAHGLWLGAVQPPADGWPVICTCTSLRTAPSRPTGSPSCVQFPAGGAGGRHARPRGAGHAAGGGPGAPGGCLLGRSVRCVSRCRCHRQFVVLVVLGHCCLLFYVKCPSLTQLQLPCLCSACSVGQRRPRGRGGGVAAAAGGGASRGGCDRGDCPASCLSSSLGSHVCTASVPPQQHVSKHYCSVSM